MLPCQPFCALKAGDFLMNWLYTEEKWDLEAVSQERSVDYTELF